MIKDMSMTRQDACNKCMDLGPRFIEHFDKIYNNPKSDSINHWINEMENWYKIVNNITLKPDSKSLSLTNKFDWFFSAGGEPVKWLKSVEEENYYDTFVGYLINNIPLSEAINKILVEINKKNK